MATKRIDEFSAVPSLDGEELTVLEKDGITYNAKFKDILGLEKYGNLVAKTANDLTGAEKVLLSLSGGLQVTTVGDIVDLSTVDIEGTSAASALTGNESVLISLGGTLYKTTARTLAGIDRYGVVVGITATGGNLDINLNAGDFFTITLNANSVFNIAAWPASRPKSFLLRVKQGTGGKTLAFGSGQFKFVDGSAPTISSTVDDVEWFVGHVIDPSTVELMKAAGPLK